LRAQLAGAINAYLEIPNFDKAKGVDVYKLITSKFGFPFAFKILVKGKFVKPDDLLSSVKILPFFVCSDTHL
jgi:hypothetical protein